MKLATNITFIKPSKKQPPLLEQVGIEEIVMEDVSQFEFTDNGILVHFNIGEDEFIPLRDNNRKEGEDWRACNLFITRKFLEVKL